MLGMHTAMHVHCMYTAMHVHCMCTARNRCREANDRHVVLQPVTCYSM